MNETSKTNDKNVKTRREVREYAMQVLYAHEVSQEPIEMLFESIAGENLNDSPDQYKFAQALVYTVLNHREEADGIIKQRSQNWDFDRIALVDKITLRMGITEFLYFPDIPPKVTINESVEMVKRFSTDQSGRFVNGLLDGILSELRQTDRMKKSGRGLLNEGAKPKS